MSSTPLFDSVARRAQRTIDVHEPAATARPVIRASSVPAPTSPFSAPVPAGESALVPNALIAAIDGIPAGIGSVSAPEYAVTDDQVVLVEAVADAITRAVVDAVAVELERITRDGLVRA